MRVLTVFAHPKPGSLNHAILERFTAGLKDAGHSCEVVDLYAIHFNPVFSTKDTPGWITPETPLHVLQAMDLRQQVLDSCSNPLQRFLAKRWLRNKELPSIARAIR